MQYLGTISKNDRMISVHFEGKLFNITVIQASAPAADGEGAETDRFYGDLQDLELTPKKDDLFFIGDRNAKVGSQEIPGVTGKSGLGVKMKQGKGFYQKNKLVKHPLATTQEMTLHMGMIRWSIP